MPLYSDIRANETVGRAIGQAYLDASPEMTCMARKAYDAFIRQTETQFKDVERCVDVIFIDEDPYANAREMFESVYKYGTLYVYKTKAGEDHPYLTHRQNDLFRAVHDFNGHYRAHTGFDRHGEEGAWRCHSQMYSGLARKAMTTETRGQNSAMVWITGEFPAQKAILLPDWMSEGLDPATELWFAQNDQGVTQQ